jgi:hypothetical protein
MEGVQWPQSFERRRAGKKLHRLVQSGVTIRHTLLVTPRVQKLGIKNSE